MAEASQASEASESARSADAIMGSISQAGPDSTEFTDSGVGKNFVGAFGISLSATLILVSLGTTFYCLIAMWPQPQPVTAARFSLFGSSFSVNRDQQIFTIVGLSGALGGLIHSLRSLYWYAGNRVLRRSWLLMYFSLPFCGSALAIVFYLILRGGLLNGEATAAQVNVFGFAATSALVGLFSPEAAEKLQQLFTTLLAPTRSGRDRIASGPQPVITSIDPDSAHPGATIVIRGRNLTGATAALFHGAGAVPDALSDTEVTVQVPEAASTGPIQLVIRDRIVTAPGILHISPGDNPAQEE